MQRNEIVQYACFSSMRIHLLMRHKRTLRLSQDWCELLVATSITVYVFSSGWRSIGHVLNVDKSCLLYDSFKIVVIPLFWLFLCFFKTVKFINSLNNSIKSCTSLSLLTFPTATDSTSNSSQEAEAGHSDFVVIALVTTIQLICCTFLFCLVSAYNPTTLLPHAAKSWAILMNTYLNSFYLLSISFLYVSATLVADWIFIWVKRAMTKQKILSAPPPPRPPSIGTCSPFHLSHCLRYVLNSYKDLFFEAAQSALLSRNRPTLLLSTFKQRYWYW